MIGIFTIEWKFKNVNNSRVNSELYPSTFHINLYSIFLQEMIDPVSNY